MFTTGAFAQVYEGPSVLSRGGSARPYGQRAGRDANIRGYVSVQAFADSGFFPATVSPTGGPTVSGTQFGMEGTVGAYGIKRFRQGQAGIDYNGTFRHYPQASGLNGTDHFLGVDFKFQLNRSMMLKGQTTLGTSSRVFSFANVVGGGLGSSFLPLNDLFDARVYFARTSMGLTYNITRRLQLDLHADGFVIRRNKALVGVNGYSPGASLTYRMNQRQWVGALFNFIHFDYPKAFGESDIQLLGGVFVHNFTKRWQAELTAGAYRVDVAGTRRVEADPIVQQLLGIRFISEAFSQANTVHSSARMFGAPQRPRRFHSAINADPTPATV